MFNPKEFHNQVVQRYEQNDQSDSEVHRFIEFLTQQEPFAFVPINDGEVHCMQNRGVAARGDQPLSLSLQEKMIAAVKCDYYNYWVGFPCSMCYPEERGFFNSFANINHKYITRATALTNRNWPYFVVNFPKAIKDRRLSLVVGEDQDLSVFKDILDIDIAGVHRVPSRNAFAKYQEVFASGFVDCLKDGDVCCFSCGPLGRVLAKELYEANSKLTTINLGSVFDPWTSGGKKMWRTHKNELPPCQECN